MVRMSTRVRGMEKEQRRMSDTAKVAMKMFRVVSITFENSPG